MHQRQRNFARMDKLAPWLRNLLLVFSDGIIVSFCVIAALPAVAFNNSMRISVSLLVFIAMLTGVAAFFSAKDRKATFEAKTPDEEALLKKEELKKTIRIYNTLGFGEAMKQQAEMDIDEDSHAWKQYLREHLPEKEQQKEPPPLQTAFVVGLSFSLGAAVMSFANSFFPAGENMVLLSTFAAVLVAGANAAKALLNDEPVFWSIVRTLLIGAAAVGCAYYIGKIFLA